MTEYVVCCFGDVDAKPPPEIEDATIGQIDFLKGKKIFMTSARSFLENENNVKFFIASRTNFYHIFDALIKAGIPYAQLIKPKAVVRNIVIAGMDYSMREELLTNPSTPINREIAKENLLLFKAKVESAKLRFFLVYGTLLGAVREGDFIAHDSDVDVGMYSQDKNKFLPLLFDLKKQGLELVRFDNNLLSLMKDGEYIDIYFFKKKLLPKVGWHSDGFYIPARYLEDLETIEFHHSQFLAPKDYLALLAFLYGSDWNVPKENKHAQHMFSIKLFCLRLVPVKVKTFIKKCLIR